jgi:LysM repeat protein
MPAPLIVAAAGTIIRYIAKNGLKKAVERYGKKAVDNARKTKGTKGEKSVENYREAMGKANSAARKAPKSSTTTTPKQVPAKRGNTTPAKAAPKKPPAVRSNANKEVGKAKAKEGEYIPKGKPVGAAKSTGKKGNTYNQEPTMRANPKDRPNRGGGGSRRSNAGKKAAAAAVGGAAAAAMLASSGDKKSVNKGSTTPSSRAATKGYTVKKGDTLSQIAQRHGVRLSELRDANKDIKDLNKIGVGQKIKVPKASIKGTGKSVYEGMTKGEMSRLAKKK